MESNDILSNQMKVCWPEFRKLCTAVSITVISNSSDIVSQRVKPYIGYVLRIEGHRNSPAKCRSGYTKILKSWKEEIVHHLILPGYGLDELRGVTLEADGTLRIGSLTSFSHITRDPLIQKYLHVLGEAVDQVGGPQIRNIGTIGGNTFNVVTSADSASTLHAYDAIVELTGPDGIRRQPIREFYIRAGKVDIRPGEIQTAILIEKDSYTDTFGHYIKYAMRNAMDIATLGTSVNVRLSADKKTVERARVAFGVAGPVPLRAAAAEELAAGQPVSLELADRFAQAVKEDINPRDSWRAAKDFRMHIAVESARRAFIEAVKLAGGDL